MIAHGTRDSTSANSGGIDGRDGGGGNSNSTWAGPEDNSASEHVLALRSGDIKTMTESAKYVHEAIAHELRRVRKGSRGLKSPSSNVYTYLGAILDCLACVGSHPDITLNLVSSLHLCAQMGKAVRKYLFASDSLALVMKSVKKHKQNPDIVLHGFKFASLLCEHEKKGPLVVRLEGGLKRIIDVLRHESILQYSSVVTQTLQLASQLIRKGGWNKVRLLTRNRVSFVKVLLSVGHFYGNGKMNNEDIGVMMALLPVLERMPTVVPIVAEVMVDEGYFQWAMKILSRYGRRLDLKMMELILKMLKALMLNSSKKACSVFLSSGGFEVVWNALPVTGDATVAAKSGNNVATSILKIASSLLSLLQRRIIASESSAIPTTTPLANTGDSSSGGESGSRNLASSRRGKEGGGQDQRSTNEEEIQLYDTRQILRRVAMKHQLTTVDANYPAILLASTSSAPSPSPSPSSPSLRWESQLIAFCPELWQVVGVPQEDQKIWRAVSDTMLALPTMLASGKKSHEDAPPGMTPMAYVPATKHKEAPEVLQSNPTGEGQYLRDMFNNFKRLTNNSSSTLKPKLVFDSSSSSSNAKKMGGAYKRMTAGGGEKRRKGVTTGSSSSSSSSSGEGSIPALSFESDFEEGNLMRAIRVGPTEYDLILHPDTNTNGFTQWFYFGVQHMRAGQTYTFNIINNEKSSSVFNDGMRPVIFSAKEHKATGQGWVRVDATSVSYFHNAYTKAGARVSLDVSQDQDAGSDSDEENANSNITTAAGGTIGGGDTAKNNNNNSNNGNVINAPAPEGSGAGRVASTTGKYDTKDSKGHSTSTSSAKHQPSPPSASATASTTTTTSSSSSSSPSSSSPDTFYTLSMSMKFPHTEDYVRLAYFYPFTYSYNRAFLRSIQSNKRASSYMYRQSLCRTRGNNVVELLTITDFGSSSPAGSSSSSNNSNNCSGGGEIAICSRPIVFLSSRVHPGEANSSWVMKGIIQFLTGESKEARFLRQNAVFKIVPILNPDGVINGNYRCNLSGVDLNRHWENPCPIKHPTIFAVKQLLSALARQRPVMLYCDFHGHSVMKNFCLYGCNDSEAQIKPLREDEVPDVKTGGFIGKKEAMEAAANFPGSGEHQLQQQMGSSPGSSDPLFMASQWKAREQIFPMMLSNRAPDLFQFSDCKFSVLKRKKGSARVVFWRELRIWNSYTMEASFCGSNMGPLKGQHYTTRDFERMGKAFCQTIYDWLSPDRSSVYRAIQEVTKRILAAERERARKKKSKSAVVRVPTNRRSSQLRRQSSRKLQARGST